MLKIFYSSLQLQRRFLCSNAKPRNHYESLGISSNSTQSEVKSAYYKLSMLHHPDKNQGNAEAHKKFRDISEAYEVLGNVKTRKLYDRGLYFDSGPVVQEPVNRSYQTRQPRTRPPTPTGSVPIYDFDEWSKSHYGATFQRQKENRRRARQYEEDKEDKKYKIALEKTLLVVSMLVIYCMLFKVSQDQDRVIPRNNLNSVNKSKG